MPSIQQTVSQHQQNMLAAAQLLCDQGFAVVPCNGKVPVYPGWNKKRWSPQELHDYFDDITSKLNIGIALNLSSVIDVECDSDEAEESLQELFAGKIPDTPTWQSQRGKHRLFRRPKGLPKKAVLKIEGIEFRIGNEKGAVSIVPPSVHPGGPRYCWLPELSISDLDPADLPAHIVDRLIAVDCPPAVVGAAIPEGTRNDVLFRLACSMRAHGATQETIEQAVLSENELRCDPPLPEVEVRQIAKSSVSYPDCATPDRGNSLINLISLTPPDLGEAAYHGFAGDFIRKVSPYTEATDMGILAHLLCAAGAMIGPGPHVYGGAKQAARINVAIVGPTSTGRKGTSFVPVELMFAAMPDNYWQNLWKIQHVSGLSSGEGLINVVADKWTIDEDGEKSIEITEKRLFVLEPEFSKVLVQCRRDGNILSQIMRESFDSGNLQTLTRGDPLRADGAHICICGHVTPEELRKRLSETDMANGFGNRFLWLYVESDRILPDSPRIPEAVIQQFADRLLDILKHLTRGGWQLDADFEPIKHAKPKEIIEKDKEARKLWHQVYPYLRSPKHGLQGAMLARGDAIVLRLSLIYALLDKSNTIGRKHMEAALAVWRYNEESVRMIFSNKSGDSLQDKLFSLISKEPMYTKQFYEHVNKPAAEVNGALAYMESIDLIRKTVIRQEGAGRPATLWELVK